MSIKRRCKHFIKERCKQNATILRLSILIINTLITISYAIVFSYSLSENYEIMTQVFDPIVSREQQLPILELNIKKECSYGREEPLVLYQWPGVKKGCICLTHWLNKEGPRSNEQLEALVKGRFHFNPHCSNNGPQQCAKKYPIQEYPEMDLDQWKNQERFCAIRYLIFLIKKDE